MPRRPSRALMCTAWISGLFSRTSVFPVTCLVQEWNYPWALTYQYAARTMVGALGSELQACSPCAALISPQCPALAAAFLGGRGIRKSSGSMAPQKRVR